jgi:hypothetical protein
VLDILQQPKVGRWAYQTALAVIEDVAKLIPEDRLRKELLQGLQPFLAGGTANGVA